MPGCYNRVEHYLSDAAGYPGLQAGVHSTGVLLRQVQYSTFDGGLEESQGHLRFHTYIVSAEGNHPTSNFFRDTWVLQLELQNGTAHEDDVIRGIAISIHERFDKYWRDCNVVLAIAVAMHPCFKMKMVEPAYSKIYGPTDAAKYVKVIDDAVLELYKEYVARPEPLPYQVPADGLPAIETVSAPAMTSASTTAGAGLVDFDMYLLDVTTMGKPFKHDLELYLEEALIHRTREFDVLKCWQDNTLKYPTSSRMARGLYKEYVARCSRPAWAAQYS